MNAYRGKIGRRREQYCIEQARYMGACHRRIAADQHELLRGRGERITCREGCAQCCRLFIGATLQECEAIAYYLTRHEAALSLFLSVYPSWREAVRRGGDTFLACEQSFSNMLRDGTDDGTFDRAIEEHNRQGIFCPFLKDERCSIYEIRPSNCAGLFVTRPPEACRRQDGAVPSFRLTSIDDVTYDTSFYYQALAQPVTLYLPVAVYRILDEGYQYLAGFPGLEDIGQAVLQDPEAQALP